MAKAIEIVESSRDFRLQMVDQDHCLLEFNDERLLLGYDALYELTLRLANLLTDLDSYEHSVKRV